MTSTRKVVTRVGGAGMTVVLLGVAALHWSIAAPSDSLSSKPLLSPAQPADTMRTQLPTDGLEPIAFASRISHADGTTHSNSSKWNSSNDNSNATETRTITVRAEYTEPIPGFDGAQCRRLTELPNAPPDCRVVVVGPIPFTGTIQGVAYTETSGPTPDGDHYEGPDTFDDGRIEGCGEGGFVLDTYDGRLDVAGYDPVTNTMPGYNRWSVRPGSGTGGLTGLISGEGENHWTMYWSEAGGETWGRGVFTGTITCEVTQGVGQ